MGAAERLDPKNEPVVLEGTFNEAITARDIAEHLSEQNPDALLATGFEGALIGIGNRACMNPVAIYDQNKCIKILAGQDMTYEEAVEFFEFNVLGSYVGEYTPIFMEVPQC